METLHDHGVLGGDAVPEGFGAVRGWDASGVKKIFGAPRNAMQWSAVFTGSDLRIGVFRLRLRQLASERDDAAQLQIEALQSIEIDVRQPLRGKFFSLDPTRELGQRGERDVLVVRRQCSGVGLAANKLFTLRPCLLAGQNRVPA